MTPGSFNSEKPMLSVDAKHVDIIVAEIEWFGCYTFYVAPTARLEESYDMTLATLVMKRTNAARVIRFTMQGQNNWIGAPGCDEALSGMMTITSLTNEERGLESGGFRPK